MLRRTSNLIGNRIHATDGLIGSVSDLLFDDIKWGVRWTVVDTGSWLPGKQVLLPPTILSPGQSPDEFSVELTQEKVENCPSNSFDRPVSRQREAELFDYYGWAPYWGGGFAVTLGTAPAGVQASPPFDPRAGKGDEDPHLRSVDEVTGYTVAATDGDIGHVEEMVIETSPEQWSARYVVVDTKNWWPGKKVLLSTDWFRDVSWAEQKVTVDLTRSQVENSPEYDSAAEVDRSYETRLFSHYGLAPYWI